METPSENKNQTEIKLDKKSKILLLVLGLLIIGSVALTYWRYIIKHDYIIQAQIDCDPETENCFVWQCDPNSLEEGEKCTGNPDNDIWYYKIFNRNAKNIPDCDPEDENCPAYICEEGEKDCSEVLCAPENSNQDEECSTPDQYLLENPPAEEEEECSPDDEECLNQTETECDSESEDCETAQEQENVLPDDDSLEVNTENQDISPETAQ